MRLIDEMLEVAFDEEGRLRPEYGHFGGLHRSVLFRDGVAVKLARLPEDRDHNRREWDLFHRAPPALQKLLARPLRISGCGSVMVVELVPETLQDAHNDARGLSPFRRHTANLLREAGMDEERVRDHHYKNIGVREDGTLCWLDYA